MVVRKMEQMFKPSVKVMRSYDYCHFEIALSSDQEMTLDQVNELRKCAAILVDESVRQYKIAKTREQKREYSEAELRRQISAAEEFKKGGLEKLTSEQAAFLRTVASKEFWQHWDEDESYFYEEEMERDEHFSMLHQFKEAKIRA